MQEFLPSTAPSTDVFHLLSLVADPEAAKARLQELTKANNDYKATLEASQKAAMSANAHRLAAAQDLEKLQKEREAHKSEVEAHSNLISLTKAELDKRESELKEKNSSISSLQETLKSKEQEIEKKHKNLLDHQAHLNERETGVSKREGVVKEAETAYAFKVQQLKEIING